jgi:hypothetical protein
MTAQPENQAGTGDAPRRPLPVLGMRRSTRANGEPFLIAVVDEPMTLAPGTQLVLQRLVADHHAADGPTHGLRVIPPATPPTPGDLRRAARDRRDGSAIRTDPRDHAP